MDSAAKRSSVTSLSVLLCAQMGLSPFFYQMSRSDQKKGYKGSREHYWDKDLTSTFRSDSPSDDACVIMIDVDYYVDMPAFLASNHHPVMLYTFQPSTVGASRKDYMYSTRGKIVDYFVMGSGKYSHQVWNYQQDMLTATEYYLGIPTNRVVYSIARRQVDEDHQFIILIPIRIMGYPFTLLDLEYSSLTRYDFGDENFCVLRNISIQRYDASRNQDYQARSFSSFSVSKPGSVLSCNLPENFFLEIQSMSRVLGSKISYTTVNMFLKQNGLAFDGSHFLTEYLRSLPLSFSTTCEARTYTYVHKNHIQDNKPGMKQFMDPIFPPFVPDQSLSNDIQMVKGRVIDVSSSSRLTSEISGYISEFAELLIPVPGIGIPVDQDYVLKQQNRPQQRKIIADTDCDIGNARVESFMKKEPYVKPSDPRPISQKQGKTKVEYSAFIYSFSDYLKQFPWCACGKTPAEISDLISGICSEVTRIVEGDGSRWDGHISIICRVFERVLLTRYFSSQYLDQVINLHRKQFDSFCRTRFGVSYSSLWARQSGSPETSLFNTLFGKFIDFVARRRSGFPKIDAFNAPGAFLGDDSFSSDIEVDRLVRAAKDCGQVYESVVKNRGDTVEFLARTYLPSVWVGGKDSVCNLRRSLGSLCMAVDLPDTPQDKLIQKLSSYWLTDRNTPIMSQILKTFRRVCDLHFVGQHSSYWSRYDYSVQYPNDVDPLDLSLVPPEVLNQVDLETLYARLDAVGTLEGLLSLGNICVNAPISPKDNLIIQGEFVGSYSEKDALEPDFPDQFKDQRAEGLELIDRYGNLPIVKEDVKDIPLLDLFIVEKTTVSSCSDSSSSSVSTSLSSSDSKVSSLKTLSGVSIFPDDLSKLTPDDLSDLEFQVDCALLQKGIDPEQFVVPIKTPVLTPMDNKQRIKDRIYHFSRVISGRKCDRILDVGSGDGTLSQAIIDKFSPSLYLGVDLNHRPFEYKGRFAENQNGIFSSKYIIPYTYDLIIFSQSLHHFQNWEAVMYQCVGMLAPAGIILVRDHDVTDQSLVTQLDHYHSSYKDNSGSCRYLSRQSLIKTMSKFGFVVCGNSNYPKNVNPMKIFNTGFKQVFVTS